MASITELLRGLMEELTREQDGTTHPEPLHYRELCRWEDEEHIYLEADLGADLGSFVDICIYRGRASIRMTRS
jgi:hypothetical protein